MRQQKKSQLDSKTPVSVVVPAYQEESTISESITRLRHTLLNTGREFEILVLPDGSKDNTATCVAALKFPEVKIIDYPSNQGKGFALRTGLLIAKHPVAAFIDGDLDLDPSVLPSYFDLLDENISDIVVGSKTHKNSQVSYPTTRRLASRAFKFLTYIFTGLNLGDTQTGLKAMNLESTRAIIQATTSNGFSFDLELLARSHKSGLRVMEMPVILNFGFTSSINIGSALEALKDMVYIGIKVRSSNKTHDKKLKHQ